MEDYHFPSLSLTSLPMVKKILLGVLALLLLVIGGGALAVSLRWDRTFVAPYPDLAATPDPSVIARGRYLAYGPGVCADCHTAPADSTSLRRGEEPLLVGGREFVTPPGTFRVPNLTPDSGTGIGRRSDGELARILRYGVRADGRAALPFMAVHDMSDSDLIALLSFLRAQAPVSNAVPDHDVNFLGKVALAFMLKPTGPDAPPPRDSPLSAPTVERGAYLVKATADCAGCHTQRNMIDGSFTGPRLAGGNPFPAEGQPGFVFVPPNLTPDPNTGRMATWTEEQFVTRFRMGAGIPGSPMPWRAFGRMTDNDLRAIYRYLRSVPAVEHKTGPSLRPKD
jgi:mono/diheme cytochrome c family protein